MRMPGIDGPGLYRALAARRPERCAHFVFMTGDALNPTVRAFLDQTDRPVLRKPFTAGEVRAVVRQALAVIDRGPRAGRA